MASWGFFPFGKPNSVRPARLVEKADAAVVGVYPSAWHVAWRAPRELVTQGMTGGIAALAVDVEPTVFWDGNADDFAERLARWKRDVSFVDGRHGTISSTSPSTNGSSGDKVVRDYLMPLGIEVSRTTFTDVYPVFLVKTSGGRRREQGDAISSEYDAIASRMGMAACSLPARMSSSKLPALAATAFGSRLIDDLTAASPALVVTLGEEVWSTFVALGALEARPPVERFVDLYGDGYGSRGTIKIAGRLVSWLPLIHPGLLKGTVDPTGTIDATARTVAGWVSIHSRWATRVRT